ncbi:hypothetical protein N9D31_02205 [Oligoflexaceae bacterium]|nr:hypothetical protein [Oligoflexaceae bacterium]
MKEARPDTSTDLNRQLKETMNAAKEKGNKAFNERKQKLADNIRNASDSIEPKSSDSEPDMVEKLKSRAQEQMNVAADYLENREPSTIAEDIGRAIKRRPEWVLAGLFVGGVAVARAIRAASDKSDTSEASDAEKHNSDGRWTYEPGNSPRATYHATGYSPKDPLIDRYATMSDESKLDDHTTMASRN